MRSIEDRLAYAVAKKIQKGQIRTRTPISDALEDYLNIGGVGGPLGVLEWIEEYENPSKPRSPSMRPDTDLTIPDHIGSPDVGSGLLPATGATHAKATLSQLDRALIQRLWTLHKAAKKVIDDPRD